MPKKKKVSFPHKPHRSTFLLAFILVFLLFILWLVFAKRLQDSNQVPLRGDLSLTIYFVGTNCKTTVKTPPCSGPYPHYLVRIFKRGEVNIVASALTDAQGHINISLPAGDYTWISNEKDSPKNKTQDVDFSISPNQVLTQTFLVDTGLR